MLLDATENFEERLSAKRLYGWHAGLFPTGHAGIHQIDVAQWRKSEEPMRVISEDSAKNEFILKLRRQK